MFQPRDGPISPETNEKFTLLTTFRNLSTPLEPVVPPPTVVDPSFAEPPVLIVDVGASADAGAGANAGAGAAEVISSSSSDVIEPPLELRLFSRGIHS